MPKKLTKTGKTSKAMAATRGADADRGPGVQTTIDPTALALVAGAVKDQLYMDGWFGPGKPTMPVAPAGTPPRTFDYPVGVNILNSPKAGAAISYQQLRNLADGYDLLRSGIEIRKDSFCKMPWSIAVKMKAGESPSQAKKRQEADPRIKELETFFQRPDKEHTWQDWTRMLLEDLLVVDAPTLYIRRTVGGDIYALNVMDGTTIKRVIDQQGFTPVPPAPAYQQFLKGQPAINLTSHEIVFKPRNVRAAELYGYGPVEQIITTVNIALRRQMHQLQYYTKGNIPDAIVALPKGWTPAQVTAFEDKWNALLEGNTEQRRKTRFIPSGESGKAEITFTKEMTLKDEMDEWLARLICWNLGLPVTALVKQMNRATSEQLGDEAKEDGQKPYLIWFQDYMNVLIQMPEFWGYDDLQFVWGDPDHEDQLEAAQVDDIYVRNGVYGVDEIREKRGKEPIGVGNIIITASGAIPLDAEGMDVAREQRQVGLDGAKKALTEPVDAPGQNGKPGAGKTNKPKGNTSVDGAEKAAGVKKKYVKASAGTVTPLMERQTKAMAGRIRTVFKQVAATAAQTLSDRYAKLEKSAGDDADEVLDGLDLSEFIRMYDGLQGPLQRVAKEAAEDALAELDLTEAGLFDLVNEWAAAFARDRAAELVGMQWRGNELVENPNAKWAITDATRQDLRGLVVTALTEGMTPAELAGAIESSRAFSEARAETIARTELAAAHVQGNLAGWRESGLVETKESILGSEHDLDDECDDNADAGAIPLDDTFPSGDEGPPYHPNCVCDVVGNIAAAEDTEDQ